MCNTVQSFFPFLTKATAEIYSWYFLSSQRFRCTPLFILWSTRAHSELGIYTHRGMQDSSILSYYFNWIGQSQPFGCISPF
jgi:hypothetical protein